MAKSTGILLDPATGDLQISPERNALGLFAQGLEIGEITYQNQAVILQASKGEFKEFPTLGVGIAAMVNDHETAGWRREIALQLEAEGMTVNEVVIDKTTNKMTIDAQYRS